MEYKQHNIASYIGKEGRGCTYGQLMSEFTT